MSGGWEELWDSRIASFADKVGKPAADINAALVSIVGEKSEAALEALADPNAVPLDDFKSWTEEPLKIPIGIIRKNVDLLRGSKETPVVQEPAQAVGALTGGFAMDVLPSIPDDSSFISMLKVGGELKVGTTEVLSAVKAALADRVGLFDLPDALKDRMEVYAEETDEPVGKSFFDLRNLVVKRKYSEIFNALGIEGSFMSEARKNKFMRKLNADLWNEIYTFHQQLNMWQETWMKTAGNPAVMMSVMMMGAQGAGAMAPAMQPPETDTLRDQAEAVIDKINKVFAGLGIPIARALAYDAERIKEVLMDDRLPSAIGATNREQMLKMLGVDIAGDYVRMERNLVRYILSVMELKNVTSGQSELAYFGAMLQLGNSIPWSKLMKVDTQLPDDGFADKRSDNRKGVPPRPIPR